MSSKSRAIPLIEHFGPVVQGEGQLIGLPTWFVRLGGCDYTCYSCDSMHAVDPVLIAKNATVMSAMDIARLVYSRIGTCPMITLSGGNPALYELGEFVDFFHDLPEPVNIAIETQGTVWHDWIGLCDYVTVSPKGPNMIGAEASQKGIKVFTDFMIRLMPCRDFDCAVGVCVKIPVFDSSDLEFASQIKRTIDLNCFNTPLYLSIGNSWVAPPAPHGVEVPHLFEMRTLLLERYIKLSETVMSVYPELQKCPILPQLHVLAFGNELKR